MKHSNQGCLNEKNLTPAGGGKGFEGALKWGREERAPGAPGKGEGGRGTYRLGRKRKPDENIVQAGGEGKGLRDLSEKRKRKGTAQGTEGGCLHVTCTAQRTISDRRLRSDEKKKKIVGRPGGRRAQQQMPFKKGKKKPQGTRPAKGKEKIFLRPIKKKKTKGGGECAANKKKGTVNILKGGRAPGTWERYLIAVQAKGKAHPAKRGPSVCGKTKKKGKKKNSGSWRGYPDQKGREEERRVAPPHKKKQ